MKNKLLYSLLLCIQALAPSSYGCIAAEPHVELILPTPHVRLPDALIKNGQYIVADLDGTLIGNLGKNSAPELNESPCYLPLLQWLQAGGRLAAITGNDLSRMKQRFFDHIPQHLRADNQVILVANGGSAFYGTDSDGQLVEDVAFRTTARPGGTVIPNERVDALLIRARSYLNDFFAELQRDPTMLDHLDRKFQFLVPMAQARGAAGFSMEELLSNSTNVFPRIEVRRILNEDVVTQIAVVGVPADLHFRLDALQLDRCRAEGVPLDLRQESFTTEINPEGVDKALAVYWLLQQPEYDFDPQCSFSIGDRPNQNDQPLVQLVTKLQMPFISVCEKDEPIPPQAWHIGGNCAGSAMVLEKLLAAAYEDAEQGDETPVIAKHLSTIVNALLVQ